MENVIKNVFKEYGKDAVNFSNEASATSFISNTGANACWPTSGGFSAGYRSNGENGYAAWCETLEAIKIKNKIIIAIITNDGYDKKVELLTHKKHEEFCGE